MIRALATTALVFAVAAGIAAAQPKMVSGQIDMTVLRDGDPIGTHTFNFDRDGRRLIVETRVEVNVRLAFINLYRYRKFSREVWHDGKVVSYDSTVNDDGDFADVSARKGPNGLVVHGPSGRIVMPLGTMVSGYWSQETVKQRRLIDSNNGRLRQVKFSGGQRVSVAFGSRSVPARHYRMTGGLNRELWYGNDGLLIKMRSVESDGSVIVTQLLN